MSGSYNNTENKSDFMTPFRAYRTLSADDTLLADVLTTIDLRRTHSARFNHISLVVKPTTTTTKFKVVLFAQLSDAHADFASDWIKIRESLDFLDPLALHDFGGLPAGLYKLFVTLETPGNEITIYHSVSHNDQIKSP